MVCFILRPGPAAVVKSVATTNSTIANMTQPISSISTTSSLPFTLQGRSDNTTNFMDVSNISDQDNTLSTTEMSQQLLQDTSEHSKDEIIVPKQRQMENLSFLLSVKYKKTNINISLFPIHKFVENLTKKKKISQNSFYNNHRMMYTNHERQSNHLKSNQSSVIGSANENVIPMVNITRIHLALPTKPTTEVIILCMSIYFCLL